MLLLFTTQYQLLITPKKRALENTVGKGENAGNLSVFHSIKKENHNFCNI